MLIKRPADIRSSEITDKKTYLNRRDFVRAATGTAALAAAGAFGAEALLYAQPPAPRGAKLLNIKPSEFSTSEKANTWDQITMYNNYYAVRNGQGLTGLLRETAQAGAVVGRG